jgi:putative ABC transport system permease protein
MGFYYFRLALHGLRRNRLLTALMIFAIGLGVASSMVTYAVYRATANNPIPGKSSRLFLPQIDSWGPNNSISRRDEPPEQLSYTDAMALMAAHRGSRQTALYPVGMAVMPADHHYPPENINAYAAYADAFAMFEIPFRFGGPWPAADDDRRAPVVVLSTTLNDTLFHGEDSVGREVDIDGHLFRVTGVMAPWNPQPLYFDAANTGGFTDPVEAFIPFTYAVDRRINTAGNNTCAKDPGLGWEAWIRSDCSWIAYWVQLDTPAAVTAYRDALVAYADAQRRSGRFNWPTRVRLHDVADWLDYEGVVPKSAQVSMILAVGFFIVCLVNTIGLLLAKFMRRATEIGVRRALGASRGAIYAQFLVEAATVGVAGGALGLALTAAGMAGIGLVFPPEISRLATLDSSLVLLTVGVAVGAAVVASFYPTWRAAQVQPAWQLKSN